MGNTNLPEYEQVWGSKLVVTFDHTGPTSYSNISGSSGTGDLIKASDFGRGGIEFLDFQQFGGGSIYTQSGNYAVKVFTTSTTTTPSVVCNGGAAVPQFVLQWFSASPAFGTVGSEVANATNLSAETIRCQAQMV